MSEDIFAALFGEWNRALLSGDPEQVTALYAPDAILLPTLSSEIRHNHAEIKDYFVHFLRKGPTGVIDESNTAYIRPTPDQFRHLHLFTRRWNLGARQVYICISAGR